MWSTFVTTLKTNLRNRSALFWLIVFPLALSTLFNGMLADLNEGYEIKAIPLAVVQDANWDKADGAKAFVDVLSGEKRSSSDSGDDAFAGAGGDRTRLLEAVDADTLDEARTALADGRAAGYLRVDGHGMLSLTLSPATASAIRGGAMSTAGDSNTAITVAAIDTMLNLYNRTDASVRDLIARRPQAAASREFWSSVGDVAGLTRETSLTNAKPNMTARYYYALLGMACLMAMGYSISAVTTAQANLSALGIRRTVAPLGRGRQLIAGFLASWLCSAASLTVALAYIRYVCGIPLGGREPAAVAAVAVASFTACALGTMIGAIPKLPHSVKMGLSSAIPCTLSLLSGLYGQFAMNLSDWITRHAPVLALVNPAQQVTNLFYDILYFDSYRPFAATCGILIAMSVLFLAAGVIMLKEQRYEHL
ncbi:ABC transporter permease [Bifidobacterium sp. MA2]|uniref:ABC transporter permease n=1 Tax=Bifidobacterium santillanense TaxID=2809028 RepID=A0ABS5ULU1_9BIFI|nr:ABC transporter permease [Bifidobacterium santillanense]MBT1171869.1 ABC transporter permease [Bifidobacterium santillanense]